MGGFITGDRSCVFGWKHIEGYIFVGLVDCSVII